MSCSAPSFSLSPPSALFKGTLCSFIQCLKCNNSNERFESFLDVQLLVRSMNTLQRAFEEYVSVERLCGKNQYSCEKCGCKVDALKGTLPTAVETTTSIVVNMPNGFYNQCVNVCLRL